MAAPVNFNTATSGDAEEYMCPIMMTGHKEGKRKTTDRHCVGSDCMAWRWHMPSLVDEDGKDLPNHEWEGYCGLAGAP